MKKVSKIPVYSALAADISIAIAKFIVAFITNSSAMLSEGIHSAIDSISSLLLLFGLKRSKKPADTNHPLGYGKEIYFWALIVSIVTFTLGGVISVYKGVIQIIHPEPLISPVYAYIILSVALLFQGASLYVALRKFLHKKIHRSFWKELHSSKDPSLFVVIYEDGAAVIGITIAFAGVIFGQLFNTPFFDGLASVMIGVLMGVVAVIMAMESRNLLVGESAHSIIVDSIFSLVKADQDVLTLTPPITMHLSPNEVLLVLDVQFKKDLTTQHLAKTIERLEKDIRNKFPEIKKIYVEARNLLTPGR